MRTFSIKADEITREWFEVDAAGQTLGRLASELAKILTGKHKPTFTPHLDVGDFVVVINADKIVLTGKKLTDKFYRRHSGYPGSLREVSARDMLAKHPNRIIEYAVKGMLPQNKLRDSRLMKLKVYAGATHPHEAQQPKKLEIKASVGAHQ